MQNWELPWINCIAFNATSGSVLWGSGKAKNSIREGGEAGVLDGSFRGAHPMLLSTFVAS